MKEKILIAGGSGFIGTNILKKINKSKFKVFATKYKNKNNHNVNKVKYFSGDIRKMSFCKKVTKSMDTVVMCAAVSSGSMIIQNNPMYHVDDNIIMNLNILKACSINNVKKFVFISSNTVYPVGKKAMRENDVNYTLFKKYFNVGWMKIFSEKLCEMYKNKMNILIVRPGNIYGPYDKYDRTRSKVIAAFITKFEKRKSIEIWGDGKDVKDFIFVDDFVNALLKLIPKIYGFKIFNIASGKSISLKKIINFLKKKYRIKDEEIRFNLTKPTMIPVRRISIEKIKRFIKFRPYFSIEKGISKTIEWYKKNYVLNENKRKNRY
tara:strand:- start:673 stop:1635 length:963 start_codon:yes stop_codon:yes gene_type:complete